MINICEDYHLELKIFYEAVLQIWLGDFNNLNQADYTSQEMYIFMFFLSWVAYHNNCFFCG